MNPMAMIAQFVEIAKTAPPAPMLINAVTRMLTQALVDECVRKGPSQAYLARMTLEGFDAAQSREFYTWVLESAALQDETGTLPPRIELHA